jgi:hypothetical protein
MYRTRRQTEFGKVNQNTRIAPVGLIALFT